MMHGDVGITARQRRLSGPLQHCGGALVASRLGGQQLRGDLALVDAGLLHPPRGTAMQARTGGGTMLA